MRNEEADLIIGRLIRTQSEANRETALLRVKLKGYGEILTKTERLVRLAGNADFGTNRIAINDGPNQTATLAKYPSAGELGETLDALQESVEKAQSATEQLKSLGI